jgi:pimeloyl-ACP methyl ester carboxylesterase
MHAFKNIAVTVIVRFALVCSAVAMGSNEVLAREIAAQDYQFPYHDPYFATITIRLLKSHVATPRLFSVDALPGRDQVPLLEGRGSVTLALYSQPRPAPLVYLIPGTGGMATDGSALWLAESFFQKGFSVLIAPSPLSWQFIIGQSSTAVPGYTPADATDLRRLFLKARAMAERNWGLRVTRAAVAGYSLGAVEAAYLMKAERELTDSRQALGIERVVMINPPLHLLRAIETVDELYDVGQRWSLSQRETLLGYTLDSGAAALKRDIRSPGYFFGLDRLVRLSTVQSKFVIGNAFRQTLAEAIFASQQITDLGILTAPATRGSRSVRQAQAAAIPFLHYIQKVVLPFWNKKLGQAVTTEELVSQGDLYAVKDFVTSDPAFRLLHNQDDFLTRPEHLSEFAEAMGDRAVVYPYGGHVGNLWHQTNLDDIFAMVKDLL